MTSPDWGDRVEWLYLHGGAVQIRASDIVAVDWRPTGAQDTFTVYLRGGHQWQVPSDARTIVEEALGC